MKQELLENNRKMESDTMIFESQSSTGIKPRCHSCVLKYIVGKEKFNFVSYGNKPKTISEEVTCDFVLNRKKCVMEAINFSLERLRKQFQFASPVRGVTMFQFGLQL